MLKGPAKMITLYITELSREDRIKVFKWIEHNYSVLYDYAQMGDVTKRENELKRLREERE